MMKISYRLSRLDVVRVQWFALVHAPLFYLLQLCFVVGIASGVWTLPIEDLRPGHEVPVRLLTVLSLESLWIGFQFLLFAAMVYSETSRWGILGEHTLTIDDDCFIEETEYNRTHWKWQYVHQIVRTRAHVVIRAAGGAHTIPRREFADEHRLEAFCRECQMRMDRAMLRIGD